jgi:hypothetical protein
MWHLWMCETYIYYQRFAFVLVGDQNLQWMLWHDIFLFKRGPDKEILEIFGKYTTNIEMFKFNNLQKVWYIHTQKHIFTIMS